MKKYLVRIPWHCTFLVKVDAEDENEAKEKAETSAEYPSLCHYCSEEIEIDEMNDDIDIHVEEI